jgi:hypothetical protein
VRYQAALRPDILWTLHSKPLPVLPNIPKLVLSPKAYQNRIKTPFIAP